MRNCQGMGDDIWVGRVFFGECLPSKDCKKNASRVPNAIPHALAITHWNYALYYALYYALHYALHYALVPQ